jgi:hypothetical protein
VPPSVGILAFGSLIDDPGKEIEAALVGRKTNVVTPLSVEFARKSTKRGGAPTLVPVKSGGCPVLAQILLLDAAEEEAKDRLWRREVNKVGEGGHYVHRAKPGPNTLIINRYENFEGLPVVLAAKFAATIVPLTPGHLAELAIASVVPAEFGRDGITYLIDAKRNGIATPLSAVYEKEILQRTESVDLHEALLKLRG